MIVSGEHRGTQPYIYTYPCRAKSLQLCLILCDPVNCNPPGSSVHGILQARILEWIAIPFSNICIHFPPNSPPIRLPRNIEQGCMWYTVGPCCLYILTIAEYTGPSQTPYLPNYPFSLATIKFTLQVFLSSKRPHISNVPSQAT